MDSIIPRLEKFATEGMFGEINVLRVGPSSNDEKSAQFQSQLGFFEVDLVTRKGKVRKVPVVVKLQLEIKTPDDHYLYEQFANEVVAYEKVLPGIGAKELHPTMYHGHANRGEDPKQDILILEDLRPQGFKVPKDVFLNSAHINLALRKLGEFHGLSYKMKISSPEKFNELKEILVPKGMRYNDTYTRVSMDRGFQKDLQSSPGYSVLNKAYKKLTSKDTNELMQCLHSPEEPFAVIIHGDFLKNNVLFQYDDNQNPCGVKIFDFATAMYADPTIDLSLFLYMHTSQGREEHWNDHLKSYWDGILSVGNPGFSFKEFMTNFSKKAVYGFIISAFFLPMMLHPESFYQIERAFKDKVEEELQELARTYGGEDSTAALTDIVRHLQHEGYLEEYLLHFDRCSKNGATADE